MIKNCITILIDNDSWILPFGEKLMSALEDLGYEVHLVGSENDVVPGWVNFLLGCTGIINQNTLNKNEHTIVVHESDLPKGKGFAPMSWQILEGKDTIPVCLIEASARVDSGRIWLKDQILLAGNELCEDWRKLQGEKTVELCLRFISEYESLSPLEQSGESTYYKRRLPADSGLDPDKSIREQMNLLRIVDNSRYPAFFSINGDKYYIYIKKIIV
jgi:methionyl-tRNA formyltransferase